MGICKESVIDDYVATLARDADPDERLFAVRKITDLVLKVDDPKAIIRALKALNSMLPLNMGQENALDKRLLTLIARGKVAQNPDLAEAIALFVYGMTLERSSVALPYVPALLSFLAHNMETTGAYSYYTLMIVARDYPDNFGPHTDILVSMLDSPNNAAKIFAMRILATLAPSHPEYAVGARDVLRNLSETGPHGIIKAEAAKAYRAIRDIPRSPHGHRHRLADDPAITGLYEEPVWQRAVGSHLSTAYGNDHPSVARSSRKRSCIKRKAHPLKRSNLYPEFVETLKQSKSDQSFEDQIAMLSPKMKIEAAPSETAPIRIPMPSQLPEAEEMLPVMNQLVEVVSSPDETMPVEIKLLSRLQEAEETLPVMDEPVIVEPSSNDTLADSTGDVFLQEMMNEVQNDFSSKAGDLLDSMGMGHLKRGSAVKVEEGSHKISAREFVLAMEKLFKA